MVAQVVTGRALGLAALGLVVLVVLAHPARDPAVILASEGEAPLFGELIRADGDLLVAVDSAKDSWLAPVARIVRVQRGRVVEDARVEFRRGERISGIGVSAGRVAVKLNEAQQVVIYERGRTWKAVDTIPLAGGCSFTGWWIDLGRDVLVVRGEAAICIYERRSRWQLVGTLPFANGLDFPVTNGDRIAQQLVGAVRLSRKRGGAWVREQDVRLPADRRLSSIAISERWLAAATDGDGDGGDVRVEIYELGAEVRHFATLPSATPVRELAISNGRLILRGDTAHQLYELVGGRWRAAGTITRTGDRYDHVTAGDLWWVGHFGGEAIVPGVVEGYTD